MLRLLQVFRAVVSTRPRVLAMACIALAIALSLEACAILRPARGTLATRAFVQQGPDAARGVIVMLPGFGDRPSDFDNHGFVSRLSERAPGYDLIGVDLHFNYYRKGHALPRLREDVIAPLRAQGYHELWLLGISMGGLGAVTYARAHPEQVRGLMLFAPFWGRGAVAADVAAASSLCEWDPSGPQAELSAEDRAFLANWQFLRELGCEPGDWPDVWVGHGESDPPSKAGQQLVARLPERHHVALAGGHDWKTWSRLVETVAPRALVPEGEPNGALE